MFCCVSDGDDGNQSCQVSRSTKLTDTHSLLCSWINSSGMATAALKASIWCVCARARSTCCSELLLFAKLFLLLDGSRAGGCFGWDLTIEQRLFRSNSGTRKGGKEKKTKKCGADKVLLRLEEEGDNYTFVRLFNLCLPKAATKMCIYMCVCLRSLIVIMALVHCRMQSTPTPTR